MARKSIIVTLVTQVGIQAIGLVTGILVARFLGPEGRGELAAIIVWVSLVAYVGNLGLPVAYTYAAARDPGRIRSLLGNGLVAMLMQWPLLVAVGLLMVYLALSGYALPTRQLAVVYLGLYIPLNLLTLYANRIQQGLGHYVGFNAVRLCLPASYVAALGLLAWMDHFTVSGVLAANLFSNLVAFLLASSLLLPHTRAIPGRPWIDLSALKQDLRYGLSAHLGMLQPFTGLQVDVLMLTLLLPPNDLGLYMAALAGAGLIRAQGVALGMVTMPEVAKHGERASQYRKLVRFASLATVLGGTTAGILILLAKPLVNLVYGVAFDGAAGALQILALAALTTSVKNVLADGLRGMGQPLTGTVAEMASLAVGMPALLLLAPLHGASGAAAAVALASASALVVTARSFFKARPGNDEPALTRPLVTVSTNEGFSRQ